MGKERGAKAAYAAPTVLSMNGREILAVLGPAQGLSSEVSPSARGGGSGPGRDDQR